MYITEDKDAYDGQETIANEEDNILMNYEGNLNTIGENEEEDDSLNDNTKSTL